MTLLLAFDLMATLVTGPFRHAHEAATGRTMEDLERRGLKDLHHRLESGESTEEDYWRGLRDRRVDVDVAEFHRVRLRGYAWMPGMWELLAACAAEIFAARAG